MPDEVVNGDEHLTETGFDEIPSQTDEGIEIVPPPSEPGLWGRLRRMLNGSDGQRRLEALNAAIAQNESAPVNYVLRGELYLEMGEYAAALADFEYAEKVASYRIDEDNWGVISQALRDRALAGMKKARRRLDSAQHSQVRQFDGNEHHQDSHDLH